MDAIARMCKLKGILGQYEIYDPFNWHSPIKNEQLLYPDIHHSIPCVATEFSTLNVKFSAKMIIPALHCKFTKKKERRGGGGGGSGKELPLPGPSPR